MTTPYDGVNLGETLRHGRVKALNSNPLHYCMINMWRSSKVYLVMR